MELTTRPFETVALEAGYHALFTLDGRHMGIDVPADNLGCYAIEPNKLGF